MYNNISISNINQKPKNTRHLSFKLVVILGIITLFLVVSIIIIAVVFRSNASVFKYPRVDTATLRIYAALDDEMTFDRLEQVVHGIDSDAKIDMQEFYGEIRPSDGSNQAVLFSFDNTDTDSEEEEEEEEYPSDFIPEYHGPNVAYDFIFIFNTTFESSPRIYKDESTSTYRYDDGGYSFFEFDTKQDAIDAYLAPEVNE